MMRRARSIGAVTILGVSALLTVALAGSSLAQTDQPSDQVIAAGRVVYEAKCAACHQADGAGMPGVFPPLAGNGHVSDTEYVTATVLNGRTGELVVDGVTYNSVMPPFPALSADEVASVVAYLQFGLNTPTATTTTVVAGGEGGSDTGSLTRTLVYGVAAIVVLIAAAIVFGPPATVRRADGGTFTTGAAWVKSLAIVVFFVLFTVMVPSLVLKWSVLSSLPSLLRDLIGLGVWLVALGAGMFLLRRAQQNRVV